MSARWSDRRVLTVLALLVFLSRWFLLYTSSSPEPDSLMMVTGMSMALRRDIPFSEAFLYGRQASTGVYFAGRFVYPIFFDDTRHLLGFLDMVTVLASVVVACLMFVLSRRYFARPVSVAAAAICALTPAVWELSTYFHPVVWAAALLLAGVYLATTPSKRRFGLARGVGSVTLVVLAFLVRVHIVLLLPGFVFAAITSSQRRRAVALLGAMVATSLVVYFAVQALIAPASPAGTSGFGNYIAMIVAMYRHSFSFQSLTRSTIWAASGLGIATLLALVVGLIFWFRSPRLRSADGSRQFITGLLCALPSVLFWLPQPTPILRHYVYPALAIVWALAALAPAALSPRRVAFLAAVIAAGNVLAPEAAYRWYNARHPSHPRSPHGAVVYGHEVALRRVDRLTDMADNVEETLHRAKVDSVLVFARWEAYAQLLYSLSQGESGLTLVSRAEFFPTVYDCRYAAGDDMVRIIHYVYFEDPRLVRDGARLVASYAPSVFLPRELLDGPLGARLDNVAVAAY